MSFVHGKHTQVLLDGRDISAYLHTIDLAAEVDTADSTTFTHDWRTFHAGTAQVTAEASGYYDPAHESLMDIIGVEAVSVLTTSFVAGGPVRMYPIIEVSYSESSPIGGMVAFDASFLSDGTPGFGPALTPYGVITLDGTGETVDLGTAAPGAVAHLHVTTVSAGDSILVTLEDASVPSGGGSNWATLATFASKSAPGAERLVIPGTVRRYVRAVWDITGTDPAITFGVSVART